MTLIYKPSHTTTEVDSELQRMDKHAQRLKMTLN